MVDQQVPYSAATRCSHNDRQLYYGQVFVPSKA
jgi:hypothetical protein